jgi:prolyl-tRNA editing enzyme YbaK/EbsC (Cys-tRNA(Pro) deacylase)
MNYHPVVEKIKRLLKENNIEFETFEHEAVRTSEEAAKVRTGYTIQQGAKALLVRVKISNQDKKFVMVVVPGDKRFDNQKLKNLFGAKDIRFATEPEVGEITGGVMPGGVPPFGNLFGLEVYVDNSLFNLERIIFNAGDKRYSIGMKSIDYKNVVNPIISDLS